MHQATSHLRMYITANRDHLQLVFFFFNDTATTEIYTLSLHDALPICLVVRSASTWTMLWFSFSRTMSIVPKSFVERSEEHTSELQSRLHLVCRLLLEKKKKNNKYHCAYNI